MTRRDTYHRSDNYFSKHKYNNKIRYVETISEPKRNNTNTKYVDNMSTKQAVIFTLLGAVGTIVVQYAYKKIKAIFNHKTDCCCIKCDAKRDESRKKGLLNLICATYYDKLLLDERPMLENESDNTTEEEKDSNKKQNQDNAQEKIEEQVEEKIEEKIEEQTEEKIEEQTEETNLIKRVTIPDSIFINNPLLGKIFQYKLVSNDIHSGVGNIDVTLAYADQSTHKENTNETVVNNTNSLCTTFNTDDSLFDIPEQNEIITDISPTNADIEETAASTVVDTTTTTSIEETTNTVPVTSVVTVVNNADTYLNASTNDDVNTDVDDHPVVIMAKINQQ